MAEIKDFVFKIDFDTEEAMKKLDELEIRLFELKKECYAKAVEEINAVITDIYF